MGIATQQQEIAEAENDESHPDTIIDKFQAITKLIAPSWIIAMTHGTRYYTNTDSSINTDAPYQQDAPIQKFRSLNKAMTELMIHCVVLFKRSPVPGNYIAQLILYKQQHSVYLPHYAQHRLTIFLAVLFSICSSLVQ